MKTKAIETSATGYTAPEAEIRIMECESFIAASGKVTPDPWNKGNDSWLN